MLEISKLFGKERVAEKGGYRLPASVWAKPANGSPAYYRFSDTCVNACLAAYQALRLQNRSGSYRIAGSTSQH